jgi:archaellum biogenesis ATPase FlaH
MAEEYRPAIPYSVRDQHVYIPGKTRHGKSTLMHRMVYQDIANGAGVTVIVFPSTASTM